MGKEGKKRRLRGKEIARRILKEHASKYQKASRYAQQGVKENPKIRGTL